MSSRRPPHVQTTNGPYAWFVCLTMTACLVFSYMDRTVLSVLIVPIQARFSLNDTAFGLLQGTTFGLFYLIMGLPLATIADSSNRRNLLLVAVIVWSVATCFTGLATDVRTLFLSRIFVAIGEAALFPCAVSLLADYFTTARRHRALSVFTMGIFIGGGAGLWIGGAILDVVGPAGLRLPGLGLLEGWRVVLLTFGSGGLIMVPLLICIREPVRLEEQGDIAGAKLSIKDVIDILVERKVGIAVTVAGFAMIAMGAQTISHWAPALFLRTHGWSASSAGFRIGLTALIFGPLGAFAGIILSETLAKRGFVSAKLMVGIASALIAVIAGLMITASSERVAFAGIIVLQFVAAFNFGTVQAALSDILPNRVRGVGASLYVMTSNLLAAIGGPLVVGLITDHVFRRSDSLSLAIRLVSPISFVIAAVVLALGLRSYSITVKRQRHII